MDEADFRHFHSVTVLPLHAYLTRLSGDASLAEDLAQEAYCRMLEATGPPVDFDGRRRYVFRIATNVFYSHYRHEQRGDRLIPKTTEPTDESTEQRLQVRVDVGKILQALRPRQRALLWLAYVEGLRHAEIAEVLGLSTLSVRPLLFRARRRMALELRARGLTPHDERGA